MYLTPLLIDDKAANFNVYFGLLVYQDIDGLRKSEVCDKRPNLNVYIISNKLRFDLIAFINIIVKKTLI